MPSSGIAGSYGSFIPRSLKNLHIVLHGGCFQFTSPTTMLEGSLFSTSSPAFIVCRFIDDVHSDRCEVIPHCSFDLHFSNNKWSWASFMCWLAIRMPSLENYLFRSSAHENFFLLMLSCKSCLRILEINPLPLASFAIILSHSECYTFILFVFSLLCKSS